MTIGENGENKKGHGPSGDGCIFYTRDESLQLHHLHPHRDSLVFTDDIYTHTC
jgi:hypothetical protein